MPRVLLTGSSGGVGRTVRSVLTDEGWDVRPFDLAEGQDLRDPRAVLDAVRGCSAVVHAGALAHDTAGSPTDIVATNVLGTWHVLAAAEQCDVSRVVYFSSAQVFGFAEGEGTPVYLPVDDDHPVTAARPYGMSKRLAEDMCQAWTTRTAIPTIVLRPVMVVNDDSLAAYSSDTSEFGAFVHVDDVAAATVLALTAEVRGHHRVTLCGHGAFDTARARGTLGWTAARTGASPASDPPIRADNPARPEAALGQSTASPLGTDVAVTHILVVADPARSRDFWVDVLGAAVYREYGGTSVVLRFADSWLLLVSGGGPTADKPTVSFAPPAEVDRVSHAMTVRVADCHAAYEALRSRGATFLTPPYDWGSEIRCFLRDPDGHLVEISQSKGA